MVVGKSREQLRGSTRVHTEDGLIVELVLANRNPHGGGRVCAGIRPVQNLWASPCL